MWGRERRVDQRIGHEQPGKTAGLNATYHFAFTGDEAQQTTIVIRDQKITLEDGHVGKIDL